MPIRLEDTARESLRNNRRASPRLELLSCVAWNASTGQEVALVNVSAGGLMVHTALEARAGEVHEFRFVPGDHHSPLVFSARVVHATQVSALAGAEYVVGLRFEVNTEQQRQRVTAFLAACTAPPPGSARRG
jgi:hypothetical protein